jgi:peptidoglycan hydrolase-like protein with peptidoglycan-binding domain
MAFLHPSRTQHPAAGFAGVLANPRLSADGYGYDYASVPQIAVGATDSATDGAVSLLTTKIWTWAIVPSDKSWTGVPGDMGGGESVSGPVRKAVEDANKSGIYTSDLATYVKKFQAAKGLQVDGIVGPKTWKALGYAGKVVTPSGSGGGGGGGGASRAPVKTDTPAPPEESIMDKVWFWPVAILVPTAAVIGGILFWPSKKKVAAAPGAIPVASNPRRRGSKRRR